MVTVGSGQGRVDRLIGLCEEMLDGRGLILASNRGPVEHYLAGDGRLQARRGSGGVVTALASLTRYTEFTWIASAMGEGDRRAAQAAGGSLRSPVGGQRLFVRYVVAPRHTYNKYYNVVCNPLLWFLQHYMWNTPFSPNVDSTVHDAWSNGYVPVNRAFGEAIADECGSSGRPAYVMLHDYHLYLAPSYVRREVPGATILHFTHIPWPAPTYWHLLPASMRVPIVESLCSCDIVGFQTERDVRMFLRTCEDFLDGARVDYGERRVRHDGHDTFVRAYPISIDVAEVRRIAGSTRAREYERALEPLRAETTIVRVDRAEPSKNVVRGFRAYAALLERYPELRGRVTFLAFLVPSRTHVPHYRRYLDAIQNVAAHINRTQGGDGWEPVRLFLENNYPQALAGMRLYDVLLVNPVIDGMNLVAKEGPVVNRRNGVMVLSEVAGAHEQLGEGALSVAPGDIEGTMEALYRAIGMPMEERTRRAELLVEAVTGNEITDWLVRQLEDMRALARGVAA